jgi:citrate synthase
MICLTSNRTLNSALSRWQARALFALGRTIGWIGHAMEEYLADRIIRPRARYVGEQPRLDTHTV